MKCGGVLINKVVQYQLNLLHFNVRQKIPVFLEHFLIPQVWVLSTASCCCNSRLSCKRNKQVTVSYIDISVLAIVNLLYQSVLL